MRGALGAVAGAVLLGVVTAAPAGDAEVPDKRYPVVHRAG